MASALESLFSTAKPFGLEDHLNIPADESSTVEIFDLAPAFVRPIQSRSPIILGRKGAGKTTILAGYQGGRALGQRSDKLSSLDNGDIVIPITAWQHFQEMVREVYANTHDQSLADAFPAEATSLYDMITPEVIEANWGLVLWEEILKSFWDAAVEDDKIFVGDIGRRCYHSLERYFNPPRLDLHVGVKKQAKALFSDAQKAVLDLISESSISCYVLFDNMDKYPVRNPYFAKVVSGFLKCLANFPHANRGIHIVYCLPEELEAFLREQSSNILKDFSGAYRIRWSPVDLLCMAARRYKIFIRLQGDKEFFQALDSFELRDSKGIPNRKNVIAFFNRLLPQRFVNRNGCEERALPYIVRHTQLLPRHLLLLLNRIAFESHVITGGWRKFDSMAITRMVAETEKDIAEQVLHPYRSLYPNFLSACGSVLRELGPVFTYNELSQVGSRFNLGGEMDNKDRAYAALYKIGILGKLIDESAKEFKEKRLNGTSVSDRSATYVYGTFHFCEEGEKSFNTDGVFCFHPLFSDYYDVKGKSESCRFFVYPSRVDQLGDVEI